MHSVSDFSASPSHVYPSIRSSLHSHLVYAFLFVARLLFGGLDATAATGLFNAHVPVFINPRTRMRVARLLTLVVIASVAVLATLHLRRPIQIIPEVHPEQFINFEPPSRPDHGSMVSPGKPMAPLDFTNPRVHPIEQLISNAQSSWSKTLASQSQTLEAAVAEYKRRYGLSPPPHFDKWYEFAKRSGVQLIDEFDTIHHALLPFWAVSPSTLRSRVREALGYDTNFLLGVLIRDGKAAHVEGGPEWMQESIVNMTEKFSKYLPDMDLAFNTHDEPRVVVPHDDLSRLVRIASDERIPAAGAVAQPKNAFSSRPADLKDTKRISEVKTTRFNEFQHQQAWGLSRLSCPPETPARALDEFDSPDNLTAYALSDLGFIYNHTAFSDICNSPSLASSFGFFDRPNSFSIIHQLFPIFSQSKLSSFQDIIYPSPWYWYGKVSYDESRDMEWSAKNASLWWRGSTTGGFSRNGGWRNQHRQQFVRKLNALDNAQLLLNSNSKVPSEPRWEPTSIARPELSDLMDVHFSHIGQCDPGDCDAQREFFDVVDPADQQEAWSYRYLLDMDGNAFSGRFYAFLQSRSLTFKMAIFREWHEAWIKPWVHYIPLSLRANEGLEAVRYFAQEEQGHKQAISMAEGSTAWAEKSVRNSDIEAWFFRLLLEYGRVVDDNRQNIGMRSKDHVELTIRSCGRARSRSGIAERGISCRWTRRRYGSRVSRRWAAGGNVSRQRYRRKNKGCSTVENRQRGLRCRDGARRRVDLGWGYGCGAGPACRSCT
nr:beta-1,2-xylosyltransferase 1 [Quercus suber]